jgi:hypothetical protein
MAYPRNTALAILSSGLLTLAAAGLGNAAMAYGGGGGNASGGGTAGAIPGNSGAASSDALRNSKPVCDKGFVLKNGACVHASLGVLPDADRYATRPRPRAGGIL